DTRPTGVPSTIPAAQPHDPVSRPTTQLRNASVCSLGGCLGLSLRLKAASSQEICSSLRPPPGAADPRSFSVRRGPILLTARAPPGQLKPYLRTVDSAG